MTAMVARISSWRRWSRIGPFLAMDATSRLLPRRGEENAGADPAAHHAALDLRLLGIPDLDPHLPSQLGEARRHAGKAEILLQARRPHGRGGEPQLRLRRAIGVEEGTGRGLAALDLDADQDV